ncbi:MAG TPA: ABC transporter ATP-binding protein [Chloroflexota bacterium]|nr:ABC transporter ATP-binding protein [Chloroflexota bacterium]
MPKIVVDHLAKEFTTGRERVVAIADLTFTVEEGELVAIVGRTGCGKSTFLSLLLGVEVPTRGDIRIDGKHPYYDFACFRGRLGVVFQSHRLMPWRTALDNARLGLEILGYPEEEQRRRATAWLHRLGLKGFEWAYPHQLSGGMQQRVSIARAFAVEPEILLCDEAFGHLDELTALELRSIFLDLVRAEHKTGLFVTHDIDEAIEMGERILVFGRPGRVLEDLAVPARAREDDAERLRLRRHILETMRAEGSSIDARALV